MSAAAWAAVFWSCVFGLTYIFIGYPALVCLLARLHEKPVMKRRNQHRISVVIVAFNEAARLPSKLRSILNSDDADLIDEVIVASDGSTDGSGAAVAAIHDPRVKFVAFARRRGKASVLNDVIPSCRSDLVVLTDARQEVDRRAIAELTASFADSSVGAVSGELVLATGQTVAAAGIGSYWKYEKLIRRHESRFRSVPGVTGALYAIRRSLFQPIPASTLLDDVVIPMQIVTAGFRCLFEPDAVAFDHPTASASQESVRKRRTIAGAAQLVAFHPEWLLPWRNPIWFEFVSHKLARLLSPGLLVLALVSNAALARFPLYFALATLQVGFYGAALAGWMYERNGRVVRLFGGPLMFVALNAVTVAALWDGLRGRFRATWQRAA